jgi:hypothetical protein
MILSVCTACPFIYQHVRNFSGIVATLLVPALPPFETDIQPPSVGPVLDSYLRMHGYNLPTHFMIAEAILEAPTSAALVKALCTQGLARLEVEWMWSQRFH